MLLKPFFEYLSQFIAMARGWSGNLLLRLLFLLGQWFPVVLNDYLTLTVNG